MSRVEAATWHCEHLTCVTTAVLIAGYLPALSGKRVGLVSPQCYIKKHLVYGGIIR